VAGFTPTVKGLLLFQFSTLLAALPMLVWVDWPVRGSTSQGTLAAGLFSTRWQSGPELPQHQIWRVSAEE
jgi:hypothetical protein